jgi:hypothetical protein
MTSRVIFSNRNDYETSETLSADPYDCIRFLLQQQHKLFSQGNLVKIGKGYEYMFRNGDIIHAEQIS